MINLILKHRFTRSQLVLCAEDILNYEKTIATDGEKGVTVREAAGYGIAGSQATRILYSYKMY